MKRIIYSGIVTVLLITIVLALLGNRIAGRALDAKLAKLLTVELGIQVTLAPVQARLLQLSVRSPKLVLGDPDKPALVATDVEVALAPADLLKRQIRLRHASADNLVLQPSRWPTSDSPWPDDYRFLDPYLPRRLELESGHYETADGVTHPLRQVVWRRRSSGAAGLDWEHDWAETDISFSAELKSLDDLLRLTRVELDLDIMASGETASKLALSADLKPGEKSGYRLDTVVQAAGMKARVATANDTAWQPPGRSTTTIDTLDISALTDLINHYTGTKASAGPEALLASALPKLALPEHQGTVAIDEIRLNDEVTRDNAFDFTTGEHGINISSLTVKGPAGILQGKTELTSSNNGWQLNLAAQITAREADQTLAPQFLNSEWLWHSGKTSLTGSGGSWGTLLYSMTGEVTLSGFHRGKAQTPVSIVSRVTNRPGDFSLDDIKIQLGQGHISGSAVLSGDKERKLEVRLKGEQLNLDFLFRETAEISLPGVAIPEYLKALPGVDLDWEIAVNGLQMPGISLAAAQATLQRTASKGYATAQITGKTEGTLDMRLDASMAADKPIDMSLQLKMAGLDIPRLFQQGSDLLDTRSWGTINMTSQGRGLEQIFKAMHGTAALTVHFRSDNDWQRKSAAEEQLKFSGDAELVIKDKQITGAQIGNLKIDSTQQDLTGTLSMVSGREPWLIADLESDMLNVTRLMALRSPPGVARDQPDQLHAIKQLGAVRVALNAKSLTLLNQPLSEVKLEVSSAPASFSVNRLDFGLGSGRLETRGEIKWLKDRAQLQADGKASNVNLDRFLIPGSAMPHVPVSGSLGLQSNGATFEELLSNLVGNVDLEGSTTQVAPSPASRRKLVMSAKQVANGMLANINSFHWGENELAGNLRYHSTAPPLWELEISDGVLSLLPWEQAQPQTAATKAKATGSPISRAAAASASLVGRALMAPARLLTGPREVTPGEKLFSSKALPWDWLEKNRVHIKGQLASLTTSAAVARDLALAAKLEQGQLSAQVSAGQLNGGKAELTLDLNSAVTPASAQVTGSFDGIHSISQSSSYPRSGYLWLSSQGQSEAELAANLNGMFYLELGQGPLDYSRVRFLTTDVATSMFQTLIPGLEKQGPELECGATLATFKDGTGITPYGFAARTRRANLLARIEVDLAKEMIKLEFDSRSRQGIGLSVGNVFSNTVQVKGPLTDPKIVPNTTGLLWRGWAAVMTGGLSVVGESVYKRALASENPCDSIKREIRKDLCGTQQAAASSPLVCPPAQ